MSNREDKLKKLQAKSKPKTEQQQVDFDVIVEEIKKALGVSLKVDASELIKALQDLSEFTPDITKIQEVLSSIKVEIPEVPNVKIEGLEDFIESVTAYKKLSLDFPKTVSIDNLDKIADFIKAIESIELPKTVTVGNITDIKSAVEAGVKNSLDKAKLQDKSAHKDLELFTKSIAELKNSLSKSQELLSSTLKDVLTKIADNTYDGSQAKDDYIPIRRVRKVGNVLLFDDDAWTGGGGGGGSSGGSSVTIPTVEVNGQTVVPVTTIDNSFNVNDIEDGATSYFGKTKTDGTWLVQSVTDTAVEYATITNNSDRETYAEAWTNRATLTYGRYDEAF